MVCVLQPSDVHNSGSFFSCVLFSVPGIRLADAEFEILIRHSGGSFDAFTIQVNQGRYYLTRQYASRGMIKHFLTKLVHENVPLRNYKNVN